MEMPRPCQQGKFRFEIVCLLCEQLRIKVRPVVHFVGTSPLSCRKNGHPEVAVWRDVLKPRSAVEGQALAQYLVGDLAVLPGNLAVHQGHLKQGALEAVIIQISG
ncbi:hypothetical protein [Aeromonas caviae]|uniref:hypothetical protein n=1 Tax=Aeromonas caviae TaxID=648 RepID=UPI002B48182E|nr:hypothetical protein [Aeromonas caviae]